MTGEAQTQGDRIRLLFQTEPSRVAIIAPFIKVGALLSLLEDVPPAAHLRCVTRWLPQDVAAGVSDPEILDVLEDRGHFTLTLVDSLHAKLYIADSACLAGSTNVTFPGLGESSEGNIEVLVATTIDDPGVAFTLSEIAEVERPATRTLAEATRKLADSFLSQPTTAPDYEPLWFPRSRRPEHAYRLYSQPPEDFMVEADRILLADVAATNVAAGLTNKEFQARIRELLEAIPLAGALLETEEDVTLTRADARSHLDLVADDNFSTEDLWLAFVNWMAHFYPDKVMKQQIVDMALRRAQIMP